MCQWSFSYNTSPIVLCCIIKCYCWGHFVVSYNNHLYIYIFFTKKKEDIYIYIYNIYHILLIYYYFIFLVYFLAIRTSYLSDVMDNHWEYSIMIHLCCFFLFSKRFICVVCLTTISILNLLLDRTTDLMEYPSNIKIV